MWHPVSVSLATSAWKDRVIFNLKDQAVLEEQTAWSTPQTKERPVPEDSNPLQVSLCLHFFFAYIVVIISLNICK